MARYKVNDVDVIFVPDVVPTPSTPPYEYVVQPGAPSAGTFLTIAAAIAAAVADGASTANPKAIIIQGGAYTENFTIPDGIFLQAAAGRGATTGQGSVTINESIITIAPNGSCGIKDIDFQTGASANVIIDASAAVNTFLAIENCDLEQFGGGNGINFAGQQLNVTGTTIQGARAIDLTGSFLTAENCLFVGVGGGGVRIGAATVFAVFAFTEVDSVSGHCIEIVALSGATVNVLDSFVNQFDPASNGIENASAAAPVEVIYTFFNVTNGGANRAINGIAGGSLTWGGLLFFPGSTNKVATTTIGAGAVHMVVDTITAV